MCWPHLDPAPLSNPPPPRDALCKILSWTTVLIQLCQLLYTHPQWNPASSARKQAKAKKKSIFVTCKRESHRCEKLRNHWDTETEKRRNRESQAEKTRKVCQDQRKLAHNKFEFDSNRNHFGPKSLLRFRPMLNPLIAHVTNPFIYVSYLQ